MGVNPGGPTAAGVSCCCLLDQVKTPGCCCSCGCGCRGGGDEEWVNAGMGPSPTKMSFGGGGGLLGEVSALGRTSWPTPFAAILEWTADIMGTGPLGCSVPSSELLLDSELESDSLLELELEDDDAGLWALVVP